MPGGQVRLRERQDHATLDDLLPVLEPFELSPQARVDHPPTDLDQRRTHRDRRRDLPLEITQPLYQPVTPTLELLDDRVSGSHHGRLLTCPSLGERALETLQQLVGHLGVAKLARDRYTINPAHHGCRRSDRHAHHVTLEFSHERDRWTRAHEVHGLVERQTVRADRQHPASLPQVKDPGQILRPVVADRGPHARRISPNRAGRNARSDLPTSTVGSLHLYRRLT